MGLLISLLLTINLLAQQPPAAQGAASRATSAPTATNRTAVNTATLPQAQQQYKCIDPSLWDNSQGSINAYKGHNYIQCNQEWALRNANEANLMVQSYLLEIETKIETAKRNNDTATLDQLKRDKVCDQSASMDDCYNSIKRRVVSHTVQIRDNTLKNNRLLVEIDDKTSAMPQTQKSKRLIELVNEQRRQTPQANQQARPCAENPFIPCVVSFGNQGSRGNQPPPAGPVDEASSRLVAGNINISQTSSATLSSGSRTESVEVENQARQDNGLRAGIQQRLNDQSAGNIYSASAYQRDIAAQEARQRADQAALGAQTSTLVQNSGSSWSAFNTALDGLIAQRTAAQTADEVVNFYLRVENSVDQSASNPSRQVLTTDGVIENRMGITPSH